MHASGVFFGGGVQWGLICINSFPHPGTLETQLRVMMDAVDELNQESIKFNKHQNLVLKQYQEKTR